MTYEDMNNLIQQAAAAEYDEENYTLAEVYYQQAIEFPDAYPLYCYGKFLVTRGRAEEGYEYIEMSYDADFGPAIVYKGRQYIENYNANCRDYGIERKIKAAGKKGHLIAGIYDNVLQMRHAKKLYKKVLPAVLIIFLAFRMFVVRLRKKHPQDSVWF